MQEPFDVSKRIVIETAVQALVQFKLAFNRDLSSSMLAELYVALQLNLLPIEGCNHPGYDLVSRDGTKYQVKQRHADVLNVDTNNFDFDYLVLVNLTDDFRLKGMWRLSVEGARKLFVRREKFRKYQASQKAVKAAAEILGLSASAQVA